MTTTRTRVSKTTKALIETMREDQADWSADYRKGFRRAIAIALIAETAWSIDAISAYIDEQLAKPQD